MQSKSTEAYEELRTALGKQIQHSSHAWNTLSQQLEQREWPL